MRCQRWRGKVWPAVSTGGAREALEEALGGTKLQSLLNLRIVNISLIAIFDISENMTRIKIPLLNQLALKLVSNLFVFYLNSAILYKPLYTFLIKIWKISMPTLVNMLSQYLILKYHGNSVKAMVN